MAKKPARKNAKPLTANDYAIRHCGMVCPFCRGKSIEAHQQHEMEGNMIYQNVFCSDCGREWADEYKLIGYTPS